VHTENIFEAQHWWLFWCSTFIKATGEHIYEIAEKTLQ
jgi:hypothetical protein